MITQTLDPSDFKPGDPIPEATTYGSTQTFYAVWQMVITKGTIILRGVGGPKSYLDLESLGISATMTINLIDKDTWLLPSITDMQGLEDTASGTPRTFLGWSIVGLTGPVFEETNSAGKFIIPWQDVFTFPLQIRVYAVWG